MARAEQVPAQGQCLVRVLLGLVELRLVALHVGEAVQCGGHLGVARAELGSLDRIARVLRVAGYVASAEGFTSHPLVVNGASQLLADVLGEAGRHARIALGVAELPSGVPVEVEFLFEVR